MPTTHDGKKLNKPFILQRRVKGNPFIIGLLVVVFCGLVWQGAARAESVESISSSILALDSARHKAVDELVNSTLSDQDATDYRDFVAYLNTRIISYCRELEQLGAMTELAGLPCPAASGSGAGLTAGGQGNAELPSAETTAVLAGLGEAKTEAEETATLQDQFLVALGDFDDMLLKEDEQIANRIPSQRETGIGGKNASAADPGTSGTGSEANEAGAAANESGSETTQAEVMVDAEPGLAGTDSRKESVDGVETDQSQSRAGVPEGRRPPPKDDDIVARQLREAAEKETDPELKKKLWEEYWKYKGVTPKGG